MHHPCAKVDRLLNDKTELTKRCELFSEELKAVERKFQMKMEEMDDHAAKELAKNKQNWIATERMKREAWEKEKVKEIKEMTIKGLQPEVERILSEKKQDKIRMEEQQREALDEQRRELLDMTQQQIRELREEKTARWKQHLTKSVRRTARSCVRSSSVSIVRCRKNVPNAQQICLQRDVYERSCFVRVQRGQRLSFAKPWLQNEQNARLPSKMQRPGWLSPHNSISSNFCSLSTFLEKKLTNLNASRMTNSGRSWNSTRPPFAKNSPLSGTDSWRSSWSALAGSMWSASWQLKPSQMLRSKQRGHRQARDRWDRWGCTWFAHEVHIELEITIDDLQKPAEFVNALSREEKKQQGLQSNLTNVKLRPEILKGKWNVCACASDVCVAKS